MDSNTSIINFIIQLDKSNTPSIASDTNDSSDHDRLRHSRLLAYSQQLQVEENDDEEFCAHVNIYREHKSHLEQDKKARTELDIEALDDDLYEPIQDTFLHKHNSTPSTSNSVDMSFLLPTYNNNGINPYNGTVIDGIWSYNYPNDVKDVYS
ncbi:9216_t:CDS:1 [Scutellospora calospora]|uniref:9216_t:CDS:1 n=1 Tax=Scutellospora calospora TaxID=85575 RepID=A0ACA9MVF5_9GLOM|nr:9216_t:CDS:1 [Scutellospora calospora]